MATLILVLYTGGCFAGDTNKDLHGKPTEVLIGTDIKQLNQFDIRGVVGPGIYRTESGGAELEISIENKSDMLDIRRTYKEPGMSAEIKNYKIEQMDAAIIRNKMITIVAVKDGLLVLEAEPGNIGIPFSLWLFYTPQ